MLTVDWGSWRARHSSPTVSSCCSITRRIRQRVGSERAVSWPRMSAERAVGIYPCIRMKGQTRDCTCQVVRKLRRSQSSYDRYRGCLRTPTRSTDFRPQLTSSTSTGRPGAQLRSLNAAVRHLEQTLARVTEPSITGQRRLYEALDPILADPSGINGMIL